MITDHIADVGDPVYTGESVIINQSSDADITFREGDTEEQTFALSSQDQLTTEQQVFIEKVNQIVLTNDLYRSGRIQWALHDGDEVDALRLESNRLFGDNESSLAVKDERNSWLAYNNELFAEQNSDATIYVWEHKEGYLYLVEHVTNDLKASVGVAKTGAAFAGIVLPKDPLKYIDPLNKLTKLSELANALNCVDVLPAISQVNTDGSGESWTNLFIKSGLCVTGFTDDSGALTGILTVAGASTPDVTDPLLRRKQAILFIDLVNTLLGLVPDNPFTQALSGILDTTSALLNREVLAYEYNQATTEAEWVVRDKLIQQFDTYLAEKTTWYNGRILNARISEYFVIDSDADGVGDSTDDFPLNGNYQKDSDGDGMPDKWEVQHGLDPAVDDAALDKETDKLNNLDEFLNGSDPNKSDTDSDGFDDELEVYLGSDPADDTSIPNALIAPKDFKAVREGENVVLSWSVVNGATGYKILYSSTKGQLNDEEESEIYDKYVVDTGVETKATLYLPTDQQFYARVFAYNDEGTEVLWSEIINLPLPDVLLSAPLNFTLESETNDLYKFTWDAVNSADGYKVFLSNTPDVSSVNYASSFETEQVLIELYLPDTNTANSPSYLAVYAFRNNERSDSSSVYRLDGSNQFTGKLNDTGITQCSDDTTNGLSCPVTDYPNQDAQYGRDFNNNDDSDGHAGFSFTKLDANGNELLANAAEWSCVKDNVTGLIWEVKQGGNGTVGDEGLHDADDRYNWYTTDTSNDGGLAGYEDNDGAIGAICHGYNVGDAASYCNTQAFVERVNQAGLCGANDWRLPTRDSLRSIVNHASVTPAVVDTEYFPQTQNSSYWSSSPFAVSATDAWSVYFGYGNDKAGYKHHSAHVRLVRGGQ